MNKTLASALCALFASAMLVACAGDGPDAPVAETPPSEVPASATVSTTALVAYMAALPTSETAEPLSLANATPPTSETDEPQPVN